MKINTIFMVPNDNVPTLLKKAQDHNKYYNLTFKINFKLPKPNFDLGLNKLSSVVN